MSPVENIALIVVIVSGIKLLLLLTKPAAWFNSVGKIWKNPNLVRIIAIVLGAIVLKYLLLDLSIVEIMATAAFVGLFYWLALASYSKDIYELVTRERSPSSILGRNWLAILLWVVLIVWTLRELF